MALDTEQLEKTAFILKTIAHPVRVGVVQLLGKHNSLTVSEICTHIGGEQSLISHHLNTMKLKGVLQSEREGKNIRYSLKVKDILKILDCVENCACQF